MSEAILIQEVGSLSSYYCCVPSRVVPLDWPLMWFFMKGHTTYGVALLKATSKMKA